MLFFICLIGGIILGIGYGIFTKSDIFDIVINACLGLFLGFAIGFTLLGVGEILFDNMSNEQKEIKCNYQTEIIALKDNSYLESRFFGVDEELNYVYAYEDPDYGIKLTTVDAKYSYIKYLTDDKQTPYVKAWKECAKNKIFEWLFMPSTEHYTFYVPSSSIVTEYKIDLE